jgi:hypothetical protein
MLTTYLRPLTKVRAFTSIIRRTFDTFKTNYNILALNVPGEGYHRNLSCRHNLISTFFNKDNNFIYHKMSVWYIPLHSDCLSTLVLSNRKMTGIFLYNYYTHRLFNTFHYRQECIESFVTFLYYHNTIKFIVLLISKTNKTRLLHLFPNNQDRKQLLNTLPYRHHLIFSVHVLLQ